MPVPASNVGQSTNIRKDRNTCFMKEDSKLICEMYLKTKTEVTDIFVTCISI
jgi:hypothetical protein